MTAQRSLRRTLLGILFSLVLVWQCGAAFANLQKRLPFLWKKVTRADYTSDSATRIESVLRKNAPLYRFLEACLPPECTLFSVEGPGAGGKPLAVVLFPRRIHAIEAWPPPQSLLPASPPVFLLTQDVPAGEASESVGTWRSFVLLRMVER